MHVIGRMPSYSHSRRMYLVNSSFINKAFTRDTIIYLIAVGFFSILSQVVILRELNVTFFGIELIYILSFAFWLIGTAIGASIGGRFYIPKEKSILNLFLSVAFLLIEFIIADPSGFLLEMLQWQRHGKMDS